MIALQIDNISTERVLLARFEQENDSITWNKNIPTFLMSSEEQSALDRSNAALFFQYRFSNPILSHLIEVPTQLSLSCKIVFQDTLDV